MLLYDTPRVVGCSTVHTPLQMLLYWLKVFTPDWLYISHVASEFWGIRGVTCTWLERLQERHCNTALTWTPTRMLMTSRKCCRLYGGHHKIQWMPHNPQCDGMVERFIEHSSACRAILLTGNIISLKCALHIVSVCTPLQDFTLLLIYVLGNKHGCHWS